MARRRGDLLAAQVVVADRGVHRGDALRHLGQLEREHRGAAVGRAGGRAGGEADAGIEQQVEPAPARLRRRQLDEIGGRRRLDRQRIVGLEHALSDLLQGLGADYLQGHHSSHALVAGLEHLSHGSLPDPRQ